MTQICQERLKDNLGYGLGEGPQGPGGRSPRRRGRKRETGGGGGARRAPCQGPRWFQMQRPESLTQQGFRPGLPRSSRVKSQAIQGGWRLGAQTQSPMRRGSNPSSATHSRRGTEQVTEAEGAPCPHCPVELIIAPQPRAVPGNPAPEGSSPPKCHMSFQPPRPLSSAPRYKESVLSVRCLVREVQ